MSKTGSYDFSLFHLLEMPSMQSRVMNNSNSLQHSLICHPHCSISRSTPDIPSGILLIMKIVYAVVFTLVPFFYKFGCIMHDIFNLISNQYCKLSPVRVRFQDDASRGSNIKERNTTGTPQQWCQYLDAVFHLLQQLNLCVNIT